jgi:hypothetical protein
VFGEKAALIRSLAYGDITGTFVEEDDEDLLQLGRHLLVVDWEQFEKPFVPDVAQRIAAVFLRPVPVRCGVIHCFQHRPDRPGLVSVLRMNQTTSKKGTTH